LFDNKVAHLKILTLFLGIIYALRSFSVSDITGRRGKPPAKNPKGGGAAPIKISSFSLAAIQL